MTGELTLPPRTGLVLSGVGQLTTQTFPVSVDVTLEPIGGSAASAPEIVQRTQYRPAALRSDRAALNDRLSVQGYAEALAQLVRLPPTTPLTIGVYGAWGMGKSTFMRFVDESFVLRHWKNNAAEPLFVGTRIIGALSRGAAGLVEGIASGVLTVITLGRGESADPSAPLIFEEPSSHVGPSRVSRLTELDRQIAALQARLESLDPTRSPPLLNDPGSRTLRRLRRRRSKLWHRMRRHSQRHVVTVWFNAWRYEDSTQIWAGLASTITRELERALPWHRRRLTPAAYALRNRKAELVFGLVVPLTAVVVALVVLLVYGSSTLHGAARWIGIGLPAGGGLVLLAAVWTQAGKVLQPVSERVLTYMRRPDYRDRMGYQHLVLDDVAFVLGRLRRGHEDPRVVVFIDDLDRCSDDKIMEILQAINLVLGESEFFVFLGVDTGMVHRAIGRHYGAQIMGADLPPEFAENYLRKVVQLPFYIPPVRPDQRSAFIASLFSPEASKQAGTDTDGEQKTSPVLGAMPYDPAAIGKPLAEAFEDIVDTPAELEAFQHLSDYAAGNPRELTRLVNVHRLVKILIYPATVRQPDPDAQRKLVRWLVFCAAWRPYVDDALAYTSRGTKELDVIAEWAGTTPMLDSDRVRMIALADAIAGPKDVISSDDLAPGTPLERAAYIAYLVDKATPQPTP